MLSLSWDEAKLFRATEELLSLVETAALPVKFDVDAKVDESPSEWTGDELREHAHKAIAPQLTTDQREFGERFGTALANSKASDDLDSLTE